jgi:hypothetical protein
MGEGELLFCVLHIAVHKCNYILDVLGRYIMPECIWALFHYHITQKTFQSVLALIEVMTLTWLVIVVEKGQNNLITFEFHFIKLFTYGFYIRNIFFASPAHYNYWVITVELPKDQLPTACLFNMNAYAPRAIRSYMLSLLQAEYQMCPSGPMIKDFACSLLSLQNHLQ